MAEEEVAVVAAAEPSAQSQEIKLFGKWSFAGEEITVSRGFRRSRWVCSYFALEP